MHAFEIKIDVLILKWTIQTVILKYFENIDENSLKIRSKYCLVKKKKWMHLFPNG